MKHVISITSIIFFSFIISGYSTDHDTQLQLTIMVEFSGDSEMQEIVVKAEESSLRLQLLIISQVWAGKLQVEIYDPEGEKQGNFSVGSQIRSNSNNKEKVRGNISMNIGQPMQGDWIIRLIPHKAEGSVNISSQHTYKTKTE